MTDQQNAPFGGRIPNAVPGGWDTRRVLDDGLDALGYPDGSWRIAHTCTRSRDGLTVRCAPALDQRPGGHVVVQIQPLTVTPSVGCDDCGLHGFITDGRWIPC